MPKTKKPAKKKTQLNFEYKISPNYNAHSVGGAVGGITPGGDILMNIFHERNSIPKTVSCIINPDGTVGNEIKRVQKDAIIRDVFMGLTMNPGVAKSIADWLYRRVEEYEKVILKNTKKD